MQVSGEEDETGIGEVVKVCMTGRTKRYGIALPGEAEMYESLLPQNCVRTVAARHNMAYLHRRCIAMQALVVGHTLHTSLDCLAERVTIAI